MDPLAGTSVAGSSLGWECPARPPSCLHGELGAVVDPRSTVSEEMGLSGCPGPQDRDEAEVALSKLAAGDMGPGLFPPFPQAGGPGNLFTHGCLTSWQQWAAMVGSGAGGS